MTATARLRESLAGRYHIEREIGAGGMATVYLARDVRHARNVALKVLRPDLGAVLGVERFLSEIRVTANLQHPNLLPLFDSGEADGLLFYVMPFVEGESLRARLDRERQLPIGDAIHLAVSVASALDYAHRHGIVHRDLKPENILLHEGQPVVADFGIALAVTNAGGARVTQTGISLGTPQYMSPEQATGDRVIDGRSDIYSLAAVAYEMLTGEAPHLGTTVQAIVARVLTERPANARMRRAAVPEHVARALDVALEKLPADRYATASEFADALQSPSATSREATSAPATGAGHVRPASTVARRVRPLATWGGLALAAVAGAGWWRAAHREVPGTPVTFALTFGTTERPVTAISSGSTVALSPDGTRIAYVATGSGGRQIYVRGLNDVRGSPLSGTEQGSQPFFSPDGKWLGFYRDRQLAKVPVGGGTAVPLADVGETFFGASWGPSDDIVVGIGGRLALVPGRGGTARPLPDSSGGAKSKRWPIFLADGETVLHASWIGSWTSARISATNIRTGRTIDLNAVGSFPLGVVDGTLIYASGNASLMAAAFDARRLQIGGAPIPVVDSVATSANSNGAVNAALSASGSLLYHRGSSVAQLVLTDGHDVQPLGAPSRPYSFPRYSPDGKRLAVAVRTTNTDIWIYEIASGALSRLTTDSVVDDRPEWSHDGRRVLFRSERRGGMSLWSQAADGLGVPTLLFQQPGTDVWEGIWTPDGRGLVYRTGTLGTSDIWYRNLEGDTARRPIATTPFAENEPRLSPDGRWIAYTSGESGVNQVTVRPFPGPGPRTLISTDGGTAPVWSRDGRHLYYVHQQHEIWAATLNASPGVSVTSREKVLDGDYVFPGGHANYDAAPDGKRLLLLKPLADDAHLVMVHDWKYDLRARVHGVRPEK